MNILNKLKLELKAAVEAGYTEEQWKELDEKTKKQYIKDHPHSKYAQEKHNGGESIQKNILQKVNVPTTSPKKQVKLNRSSNVDDYELYQKYMFMNEGNDRYTTCRNFEKVLEDKIPNFEDIKEKDSKSYLDIDTYEDLIFGDLDLKTFLSKIDITLDQKDFETLLSIVDGHRDSENA